jgi:hypothetical protein
VTAAIFPETTSFFAFLGLSVYVLGFSAAFQVTGSTARLTAISLTSPTTLAHTKAGVTPATKYRYQFQHPVLKITGKSNNLCI